MAATAGFRNRITLDGAQEVTRGFAAIGKAGEQAFGNVRSAVADSSRGFLTLRGNLNDLSTSFQGVARTSIGFKTAIAGLVTGGVVAGITGFVKAAATAADDVGDAAAGLGLSAERFQEFKLAARTAGLDIEKFSAAFSKLSATVDTESKKQIDALSQIGKAFSGDQIINQSTNVLRGMQDIKAASTEAGVSVKRGADQAQSGFIKISDAARDKLGGVADLLRGAFKQVGVTTPFPNLESQLAKASQGTSEAAVKIRKSLSDLGVELPAETVGEALDKLSETAEQKLGSFVQLWERTGEGLRKRRLDEVFLDFADAMKAIQDPAQRSAAVIGVFGARIGARLVPLLQQGRDGILEVGEAFTKAGLNFTTADTKIGGDFADQLDILSTALTNARNLFALPISAAFQPVLEAATKAIQDNAGTIRAWAADIAGRLQPAIADFIALIQQGNQAELKTEFARDLVGVFQSIRDAGPAVLDTVKLIGAAFRGVFAAADAALAPVNALFGTKFRGDVLLGVVTLIKIVGGFAAITAAIALARTAFVAFTILASRSPFGLLAAAVALFVSKMSEGTETAQKFWASITGDSGETAKTLNDTAANAASFGTAASEAEKAVAGALGTTQRLGDAAQTTGARFVTMAAAVPKMVDGLPDVRRGIQDVASAVDQVGTRFHDVAAETRGFRKEIEAAAKEAAAPLHRSATAADASRSNLAEKPLADKLLDLGKQPVLQIDPLLADIDHLVASAKATLSGDWTTAWNEAGAVVTRTIDDTRKIFPGLADAMERGIANIKGIDWQRFFGSGFEAAENNLVADMEGIRVPLPKFLDDWIEGAKQRLAELKKLLNFAGSDPQFVGAAGEAPPPGFLSGWTDAVTKWNDDTRKRIEDNFAQIGPPAGSALGPKLLAWAQDAASGVADIFSKALAAISPISSAQAAPLTTGVTGAAGATGAPSVSDTVDAGASAIDDARSRLNDLISSIPTAVSDALNQVSALITEALDLFLQFVEDQATALTNFASTSLQTLTDLVNSTIDTITGGLQATFDTLQGDLDTVFSWITSQIDTINGFLSTLADTVSAIGSAIGSAVGSVAGVIPGFAGGGHIRGPGTSTSDSVLIAASAGEHVTRAKAVSYYGPGFFDLINRMVIPRDALRQLLVGLKGFSLGGLVGGMSQPIVNFSIPRFAEGGLVSAPAAIAGGGTTVPIVLDGKTFNFLADDDVAESFVRTARRKQMTSAGRRVGIR